MRYAIVNDGNSGHTLETMYELCFVVCIKF